MRNNIIFFLKINIIFQNYNMNIFRIIKTEIITNIVEEILFKIKPLFKKLLTIELPTKIETKVYHKKSIIEAMAASINLSNEDRSLLTN